MKRLPTKFRSGGWDFKVLARRGRVALLSKTKPNLSRDLYEVVIIQERKAHVWPNGIESVAHEAMPCSEDWGVYGWTPFDEERAWELFEAKCQEWPETVCTEPQDASEDPGRVKTPDKGVDACMAKGSKECQPEDQEVK